MAANKRMYKGHMANGVIVLDEPAKIADGAPVEVTPLKARSLAERLRRVIGKAKGLPSDLARNHDHYLHGRPKK